LDLDFLPPAPLTVFLAGFLEVGLAIVVVVLVCVDWL
jgi:hypothetical protein